MTPATRLPPVPSALILALFLAFSAAASPVPAAGASAPLRFRVGLGAGYESGNGVQIGMARGRNAVQAGLGFLYEDQTAEFGYSTGLRFLRTFYEGRINRTYGWAGASVLGHWREGDAGVLGSEGLGVGISLHFGLPFHLELDSGWHVYLDSQAEELRPRFGPTLNGALLYEW